MEVKHSSTWFHLWEPPIKKPSPNYSSPVSLSSLSPLCCPTFTILSNGETCGIIVLAIARLRNPPLDLFLTASILLNWKTLFPSTLRFFNYYSSLTSNLQPITCNLYPPTFNLHPPVFNPYPTPSPKEFRIPIDKNVQTKEWKCFSTLNSLMLLNS